MKLAQLVVDHITLLVFVLISAWCVDKWDIVLQNVPTKEIRQLFHMENVLFCTYALDEEDIEDFVAFFIQESGGGRNS